MRQNPSDTVGLYRVKVRPLALQWLFLIVFWVVPLIGTKSYADTINTYNFVQDAIGYSSNEGCSPLDSVVVDCEIKKVPVVVGSTSANVEISLWDTNGSYSEGPSECNIYIGLPSELGLKQDNDSCGVSLTETNLSKSVDYQDISPQTIGIYNRRLPNSNRKPDINHRNLRVQFFNNGKRVAFNGPTQVTYTNIKDGTDLTSLPVVKDAKLGSFSKGFQGTATGGNGGISHVYLSLQNSNGLYWGGPSVGWSHLRLNLPAEVRVLDEATHQIEWTKASGWPTGSDLPNGQYTLRTMARVGGESGGAGTLNTIKFSIRLSAAPSSINYFRIKSNWESDTYLGDGGTYGTYAPKPPATDTLYQWQIIRVEGEYLRFKNRSTGDLLHIENNTGNVECTPIRSAWHSSEWKEEDPQLGVMRFSNRQRPDQYIHIDDLMGIAQSGAINPTWKSAQWKFEFVGTDFTSANNATLAVPSTDATVSEISYLKGYCNDNIGGSGVKRVGAVSIPPTRVGTGTLARGVWMMGPMTKSRAPSSTLRAPHGR